MNLLDRTIANYTYRRNVTRRPYRRRASQFLRQLPVRPPTRPPPPPPPIQPLQPISPLPPPPIRGPTFNFNEPVYITPTSQEINNSTTVLLYSDCSSSQTMCPITRDTFISEDSIMKINHCGHIFKEDSLRNWFQTSSLCPVCRHDIRETPPIDSLMRNISNIITNTLSDASNNSVTFSIPFTY